MVSVALMGAVESTELRGSDSEWSRGGGDREAEALRSCFKRPRESAPHSVLDNCRIAYEDAPTQLNGLSQHQPSQMKTRVLVAPACDAIGSASEAVMAF